MATKTPNIGLNIPEDNDHITSEKFWKENLEILDGATGITSEGYGTLDAKINENSEQVSAVVKYPILDIEQGKVTRKDKPYGHVDRYGADPLGIQDSTTAIQTAVDIMEELGMGVQHRPDGLFPITFSSGSYLITKTIQIKCDPLTSNPDRPITLLGNERKRQEDALGKGTQIRPLIPNHVGKTYANAFAINVKYNSYNDDDDTHAHGGGVNTPIMGNITFKNISFKLTEAESATYNICAVKAYRTRMDMSKMFFDNMWRCLWEPTVDRLGASSYCDFSSYADISINGLKYIGFELCTPDNVSIDRITHHRIRSTFDCILKITNGGGIRVSNFQSAYHFDESTGALIPRNDGTGLNGTKAYIKLINVHGISFDGIYVERPLADYMFYVYDSVNISINNYYERFFGNGFIKMIGKVRNVKIENIYRHANIVSEYLDFVAETGAVLRNIKIKNFISREWYNESISLATTDYSTLTQIPTETFTNRDIKHNFTYAQAKHIEGETLTFKATYTGSAWTFKDLLDNDMSDIVGSLTWQGDGLTLQGSKVEACRFISATEGYISATSLPHTPIIRGIDSQKIRFFDRATGNALSTPDTKCCVLITINTVLNTNKLPS